MPAPFIPHIVLICNCTVSVAKKSYKNYHRDSCDLFLSMVGNVVEEDKEGKINPVAVYILNQDISAYFWKSWL